MENWQIFFPTFFALLLFLLFLFIRIRADGRHRDYGIQGEKYIARILQSCASENDRIINDIILYNEKGCGSSQIDHIFIGKSGVFVIETKNKAGIIYGSERLSEWEQVLGNGKIHHIFHSPILQNKTHVLLLKRILRNKYPVHGLIVFVQGNTQNIQSDCVLTPDELSSFLQNESIRNLTPNETENIYREILFYRDKYPVSPKEHLNNIAHRK